MPEGGHWGAVRRTVLRKNTEVGLDQLLMIRLAQQLGAAPDKLRGKGTEASGFRISVPIAEQAARHFSEDLRHFVRAYAGAIPRHAFVETAGVLHGGWADDDCHERH